MGTLEGSWRWGIGAARPGQREVRLRPHQSLSTPVGLRERGLCPMAGGQSRVSDRPRGGERVSLIPAHGPCALGHHDPFEPRLFVSERE